MGTDGKPRPLHVDQALDVIDFDMVRPQAYTPQVRQDEGGVRRAEISRCRYFCVEEVRLEGGATYRGCCEGATFEIWGSVAGRALIDWAGDPLDLPAIRFSLLPATLGNFGVHAQGPTTLLRAYAPE